MKRMLFAMICVACTGTAWAQMPTLPQPTPTVAGVRSASLVQQMSGGGPACGTAPCDQPSCNSDACVRLTKTKTICVPEPATKVTVKINYSSVCEKVCFPKCTLWGSGCDSGCEQGKCEHHAYQKKYLVKRICTTECPTTKCVPVEVPVCQPGCAPGVPGYAIIEPAVVPPTKK
jgi:hypothetical protein